MNRNSTLLETDSSSLQSEKKELLSTSYDKHQYYFYAAMDSLKLCIDLSVVIFYLYLFV